MPQITPSAGVALIASERERQISKEGWSAKHDDKHACGELTEAALCYALVASAEARVRTLRSGQSACLTGTPTRCFNGRGTMTHGNHRMILFVISQKLVLSSPRKSTDSKGFNNFPKSKHGHTNWPNLWTGPRSDSRAAGRADL